MSSLIISKMNPISQSSCNSSIRISLEPSSLICKICLEEKIEPYRIVECGCSFCKNCLKEYVSVLINEGLITNLTCPDADCQPPGRLSVMEIEKLTNRLLYARYRQLKMEHDVNIDPSRTFCPAPNCDSICIVEQTNFGSKPSIVYCQKCHLEFCSCCKTIWKGHGLVCETNFWGDAGIDEKNEEIIKRCPICKVPIERDSGCAQMLCRRCKHVFCWYCLTSLDNDFMLRHYDNGPCKDKLGHSKASVFGHRLQVVALFAGFGLLVLLAAPVLILVVPCLLCCKCKFCQKFNETEDDSNLPNNTQIDAL